MGLCSRGDAIGSGFIPRRRVIGARLIVAETTSLGRVAGGREIRIELVTVVDCSPHDQAFVVGVANASEVLARLERGQAWRWVRFAATGGGRAVEEFGAGTEAIRVAKAKVPNAC
jgi:hypothetical protein